MNNFQILKKIKEEANILDVLSKYLKIKNVGKNFFSICPFHNDSNPSLSISEELQIFKCFSCSKSGDIIVFLTSYDKINLNEEIDYWVKKLNIKIENILFDSHENKVEKKLLSIYELSNNFFVHNVNFELSNNNKFIESYLQKRFKNYKTILSKYSIGLSETSQNNKLFEVLVSKNFDKNIIESSKISNEKNDFFKHRLIFPLKNKFNKIISFCGRSLNPKEKIKYLFLPNTLVFKKNNFLYNFNTLYNKKFDNVYLVEGFFDVIALTSLSINNVVGLMGLELYQNQINSLKSITTSVTLWLDNDLAGKEKIFSLSKKLLAENFTVKIIKYNNEKYKDPDELLKTFGEEEIKNYINKNTYEVINYFIELYDKTNDNKFLLKVILDLLQFFSPLDQEQYINKISAVFQLSKASLKVNINNHFIPEENTISESNKFFISQKWLLFFAIKNKNYFQLLKNDNKVFNSNKLCLNLFKKITLFYELKKEKESIKIDDLNFENKTLKELFLSIWQYKDILKNKSLENKEKIIQYIKNIKKDILNDKINNNLKKDIDKLMIQFNNSNIKEKKKYLLELEKILKKK